VKRPFRITEADRAARSARMTALNADPEMRAKAIAGCAAYQPSPERREQMSQVMKGLRSGSRFELKRKRARAVEIPDHVHPLVRGLFFEINNQRAFLKDVETRADFCPGTVGDWRRLNPIVPNLDAALNALDLELAIVPIGSRDANGFVKKGGRVRRGGTESVA
jgi:hypothetical protein